MSWTRTLLGLHCFTYKMICWNHISSYRIDACLELEDKNKKIMSMRSKYLTVFSFWWWFDAFYNQSCRIVCTSLRRWKQVQNTRRNKGDLMPFLILYIATFEKTSWLYLVSLLLFWVSLLSYSRFLKPFQANGLFTYLWKLQETLGFFMFLGGIKMCLQKVGVNM